MTPFHLLVLAVAVYRATRLVTADTVSERPREWLRARSHKTMVRHDLLGVTGDTRVDERTDRPASLWLWKLITCPWCSSVWLGALAIGTFLTWPTPTLDVAYVLGCSAVAGILMERT